MPQPTVRPRIVHLQHGPPRSSRDLEKRALLFAALDSWPSSWRIARWPYLSRVLLVHVWSFWRTDVLPRRAEYWVRLAKFVGTGVVAVDKGSRLGMPR
jgi:hypothetical protein